ncbi:SDR family NAD(P)-dependent oxidoreductase [Hydrogenophaga sp.]|uniref:SDR family NAD(P)-dependent oxidoreductase n=1 Tax=Hydrogenophaga sp. TaxID=1904254 RepID=UPI002624E71F|nr:SDR family NAD(P)-dependent oxidoreductase [Hydrogenophaga sp.]MCW5653321.1 SDR family oxidoreductase [Hydrogenophaga sp.]
MSSSTAPRRELDGQVCIVTGGTGGIGSAVCEAFAREGARVAVLDLDAPRAQALAQRLGGRGYACDVSDSAQVNATVDAVAVDFGRIDVLVNNAGIVGGAEYSRNLARRVHQLDEIQATGAVQTPLNATADLSDEEWRRMLAIGLDGTFFCTRAALRHMQPRRSGAIVNLSSVLGIDGGSGVPHYAATKAAINGFTRAVAQEVAPLGIRVNAVAPGFIATAMRAELPEVIARGHVRATPLGRLGEAREIAETILFLVSERSSFFVGQVLSPNGGYLSR